MGTTEKQITYDHIESVITELTLPNGFEIEYKIPGMVRLVKAQFSLTLRQISPYECAVTCIEYHDVLFLLQRCNNPDHIVSNLDYYKIY